MFLTFVCVLFCHQFIIPASKPSPLLYQSIQRVQCLAHPTRRIVQLATLELDEEDVLKIDDLRRPLVDACEIDVIFFEALECSRQSAGFGMINRERDQSLGLAGLAGINVRSLSDDQESRHVILLILDALRKNVEIVDFCCEFAGDCCTRTGCVFLHQLCCSARGISINPLSTLQVCTEEDFALSERLRMAENSFDVIDWISGSRSRHFGRWSVNRRSSRARRRVGSGEMDSGRDSWIFVTKQVVTDIEVSFAADCNI